MTNVTFFMQGTPKKKVYIKDPIYTVINTCEILYGKQLG